MTEEKKEKLTIDDIPDDLIDELLDKIDDPKNIMAKGGLLTQLTKKILERSLCQEMTDHLGYEKHSKKGYHSGNSRNGHSSKTLKSDHGEIPINSPRDRNGTFEPKIVPKGKTHFDGFDDIIISLYTRGMSIRDIQDHIKKLYQVDVSPDLISNVTDAVLEEITEWQNRPLDKMYPIIYLDAIMIKMRDEGHVINKVVYMVLGVNMDGKKDILGLWVQRTEGAKFWMRVLTELKNRGIEDILITCIDGLKGFPEAINSIYPDTEIQLCVVHMIRGSLRYVPFKDRKIVAKDLKLIYTATTADKAEAELTNFRKKWDGKYPSIYKMWKDNWKNISTFFAYDKAIRKVIYTTNAIESINYSLRKITKTRGAFPTEDAALKLLYLGIKKLSEKWTMPIREWGMAINQFAVLFGDRVPLYGRLD